MENHITVSFRTPFSSYYLQAAAMFTRLSGEIEKDHMGKDNIPEEVRIAHRVYITSAIFAAVAFLEAAINEVYADAVDHPTKFNGHLNADVVKLLTNMWQIHDFKRYAKILEKYQIALKLTGNTLFEKGLPPYQDVPFLIKLRNAFVHYEPEWIIVQSDEARAVPEHKFESMLRGKFPENPLIIGMTSFYPNRCLGHGCARWAVTTCKNFTDDFFTRMNIATIYEHVRSTLIV